ncbi:MAG TPA: EVE domain-containing protein [Vicinamibacteria bacterium]|nr:EVE domain-containing protein [Vicinamibacteria bacterium]
MGSDKSYWLMKSEPDVFGIDDLERDRTTHWDGVRNFRARNYMRSMKVGDGVLFYHSNADPKAIVGLARVVKEAYPDFTQFDRNSRYYDRRATEEKPYWFMVEIEFVKKLDEPLSLETLRGIDEIQGMALLKKGQRLSVQPVTPHEWKTICKRAGVSPSI